MRHLVTTLCLFISTITLPLVAVPAQVTIISSAEVDAQGELTRKGIERAGAFSGYFAESCELIAYGPPIAVFAARPTTEHPTDQYIDTVTPTAYFLSLSIHNGYAPSNESELASEILNNSYYDDANVLVCWPSKKIPSLAKELGVASPPPFPPENQHVTWVITFDPQVKLRSFHQALLFGDPA